MWSGIKGRQMDWWKDSCTPQYLFLLSAPVYTIIQAGLNPSSLLSLSIHLTLPSYIHTVSYHHLSKQLHFCLLLCAYNLFFQLFIFRDFLHSFSPPNFTMFELWETKNKWTEGETVRGGLGGETRTVDRWLLFIFLEYKHTETSSGLSMPDRHAYIKWIQTKLMTRVWPIFQFMDRSMCPAFVQHFHFIWA